MKISILGLGYVGAVSLACLARDGHEVVGVDIDPAKLAMIRDGKTPVVEEGMVELIGRVVASGRVRVTEDVRSAVDATDVSLVCVGTPSAANGSQDQTAILRIAEEIGAALAGKQTPHLVVFRSTVVPGTVEEQLIPILESSSGRREGDGWEACFQPEFLREGSSIRDYDRPPFTIVGTRSGRGAATLEQLFGHLPCRFVTTSIRAAEMLKYACNNFHALKITFANETARLCNAMGVDPFEVMDLVCQDTHLNISKAYLRPGFAFGGSCLPKDLRATMHFARTRDVEVPMLGSILRSNREHVDLAIRAILDSGCRRVGMIGLSFKTGTDDLRESPLVTLAEQLIGKGVQLRIYDPEVQLSKLLGGNRRYIEAHLPHIGSMIDPEIENVIRESEWIVVGIESPDVMPVLARQLRPGQVVLDLVGLGGNALPGADVRGVAW